MIQLSQQKAQTVQLGVPTVELSFIVDQLGGFCGLVTGGFRMAIPVGMEWVLGIVGMIKV